MPAPQRAVPSARRRPYKPSASNRQRHDFSNPPTPGKLLFGRGVPLPPRAWARGVRHWWSPAPRLPVYSPLRCLVPHGAVLRCPRKMSDGQQCAALGGDALESSGSSADSKLVLAPPNPRHRVTIYIAFSCQSTFTVRGVWSYFRKFGPVTFLKILGATRGWVSCLYPETVELLLSETRSNRHSILGALVHIFSSMEKLEWKVSGQEESDKVSDVNVSYEHHIGEKSSSELEPYPEKLNNECDKVISADKSSSTVAHGMASEGDNAVESSDLSNCSDKASADQDIDDSGLQDDLAVD